MTITYIDVETTGLDPKKNSIFQLAGKIVKDGIEESFNYRMRPYRNELIEEGAKEKTGITDQELASYPDQREAFNSFLSILDKNINVNKFQDRAFFVGYNSSFDMDFIRSWFLFNNNTNFSNYFFYPSLDVMYLAAFALIGERPWMRNFKLTTVYKKLTGKELEDAHNAESDINATVEILNIITKKLKGDYN